MRPSAVAWINTRESLWKIYGKLHFLGILTKTWLKIKNILICISKPFPKLDEIQNLSLDTRQGNKEKYLPLLHSVFFFKFCNTDKYPKCIGLKIGDFGFLYIFVYESKSICSRQTYNTFLESSFYEAFRKVLHDYVPQILFDL